MDQPKKDKSKVNRPDTPLADSPTPDYRNMPDTIRGGLFSKDKPYVSTAQDTVEYKKGFERGLSGDNKFFPSRVSLHGYKEAKERKLTPKQNRR